LFWAISSHCRETWALHTDHVVAARFYLLRILRVSVVVFATLMLDGGEHIEVFSMHAAWSAKGALEFVPYFPEEGAQHHEVQHSTPAYSHGAPAAHQQVPGPYPDPPDWLMQRGGPDQPVVQHHPGGPDPHDLLMQRGGPDPPDLLMQRGGLPSPDSHDLSTSSFGSIPTHSHDLLMTRGGWPQAPGHFSNHPARPQVQIGVHHQQWNPAAAPYVGQQHHESLPGHATNEDLGARRSIPAFPEGRWQGAQEGKTPGSRRHNAMNSNMPQHRRRGGPGQQMQNNADHGWQPEYPDEPYVDIGPERVPVFTWNLKPSYTVQELQEDLLEIDFEADHVIPCGNILPGSFLLWYGEEWMAHALIVSLDGINEWLQTNGNPIRIAKWSSKSSRWSAEDIDLQVSELVLARMGSSVGAHAVPSHSCTPVYL